MEYSVRTTSSRTPAIPDDRRYVGVATRCFSSQPDSEWLGPAWTISPCGAAQALASRVKVIIHVVEERAPITVRGVCYALFVRERRQCARREPSGLLKGFGSFTSVKEEAEYASDCRGATPERVPILHP